jgi:hypothetical protein
LPAKDENRSFDLKKREKYTNKVRENQFCGEKEGAGEGGSAEGLPHKCFDANGSVTYLHIVQNERSENAVLCIEGQAILPEHIELIRHLKVVNGSGLQPIQFFNLLDLGENVGMETRVDRI